LNQNIKLFTPLVVVVVAVVYPYLISNYPQITTKANERKKSFLLLFNAIIILISFQTMSVLFKLFKKKKNCHWVWIRSRSLELRLRKKVLLKKFPKVVVNNEVNIIFISTQKCKFLVIMFINSWTYVMEEKLWISP